MRTRAIILKKQNTGEYDQLITCYTEEFGKLTAVAKSALKPNSIQAMHLDIFNLVDFELINGRATPIIAGAQAERMYSDMKTNLPALAGAYFFAEVFDRLVFDYQRDDEMWGFLTNLLEDFDKTTPTTTCRGSDQSVGEENFKELFKEKQASLISLLGYAPNMSECIFCSSQNSSDLLAYSPEGRGMVCKNCFFGGQRGIVLKNKELPSYDDCHTTTARLRSVAAPLRYAQGLLSISVMNAIFESLAERELHSLKFIRNVLE